MTTTKAGDLPLVEGREVVMDAGPDIENKSSYRACLWGCGNFMGCLGSAFCCLCAPYKQVEQGSVGIVKRFGRFNRLINPGLHKIVPCAEELREIDMRLCVFDLQRQKMMTHDNLSVDIDIVLRYKIRDPMRAVFEVANVHSTVEQFAYTTLRTIIGAHELQDLLANRAQIAGEIADAVKHQAIAWGVHIDAIDIKDVHLPRETEYALSAAAVAERTASAKIISARADVQAAELMRQASDVLNTPAAMQIRFLDNLSKLATSPNAKVVFMPTSVREVAALQSQLAFTENQP